MNTRRWLPLSLALLAACSAGPLARRGDGLDEEKLPPEIRADYGVFTQRCSKCHALSRALNSGITDDEQWELYVARMRRQPSSGISEADTRTIMRFLHYYSAAQRRAKSDVDGGQ